MKWIITPANIDEMVPKVELYLIIIMVKLFCQHVLHTLKYPEDKCKNQKLAILKAIDTDYGLSKREDTYSSLWCYCTYHYMSNEKNVVNLISE